MTALTPETLEYLAINNPLSIVQIRFRKDPLAIDKVGLSERTIYVYAQDSVHLINGIEKFTDLYCRDVYEVSPDSVAPMWKSDLPCMQFERL